jgi:hypothetical protein
VDFLKFDERFIHHIARDSSNHNMAEATGKAGRALGIADHRRACRERGGAYRAQGRGREIAHAVFRAHPQLTAQLPR